MRDMEFIDTHCHIYDEAFKGEEDAYIARAEEAGVRIMLQPDVDSRERDAMFSLTDRHPGVLRPMLGLYPGSVDKDWRMEIDRMLEYSDRKVVAIGEIGLDYYYGKEFASEQREALHWQLDYARERDLPVNIHLRDVMGDFLEILKDHKGLRGNMHAYSGSYESFLELQELGDWYIGGRYESGRGDKSCGGNQFGVCSQDNGGQDSGCQDHGCGNSAGGNAACGGKDTARGRRDPDCSSRDPARRNRDAVRGGAVYGRGGRPAGR